MPVLFIILVNAIFKIFIFPLFTPIPYYDNLEAIYLGGFTEFGNYKHPPLLNFIMQTGDLISSRSIFFLHIIPQIYFALLYFFVYKLASKFVSRNMAIISTVFISFFPYFSVSSQIFAQDVILALPFVASIYFYVNFLEKNSLSQAILLGISIGLGMLGKYFFVVHALSIFIHAIFVAKLVKNPKIYIAGLVSLFVFLPNLLWLVNHDFIAIKYGYSTGGDAQRRASYSLFLNYLANITIFVVIIAILSKKLPKLKEVKLNIISYFVIANGVILLAIMFFGDMHGKSRFLQMFAPILPLFAIIFVGANFTNRQTTIFTTVAIVLISISHIVECFKSRQKNKLENQNFKEMVKEIEAQWVKECGNVPIKYFFSRNSYMLGGIWLFFKDKPHFVPHSFAFTPYLSEEDYNKNGGIIIYNEFKKEPEIVDDGIKKITFKSHHFKKKNIENTFLVGFKCPI